MIQKEFLTKLLADNPDSVIIGSLGTICYDLTDIPHENKVLVRGAMGSVMGIGLGYALNTDKKVIVVIGDGSFLMKMGSIATILRYNLKNLKVIILNNNKHKSTGGQETNFKYIKNNVPESFDIVELDEILPAL